jgi:glutamine amidotransferase-like uncharacterized protein
MNDYKRYLDINKKTVRGERVLFSQIWGNITDLCDRGSDRVLRYPRIGLYTGIGASHSWLWFVDIFERMGFYNLTFLDENNVKENGLNGLDVFALSGGDTFAVAEALGEKGARYLDTFIRNGGLYIGSCAGAYLPLHSSKEHLNLFNFVQAKITNLTKTLPSNRGLREKFCTPYGCSFIFHPVREAVRLKTNGFIPFSRVPLLTAPLYGGPPMIASDPSQILAIYSGFTDKTLFLVDEQLARETLLGKAAVIRKKMGSGHLHLYGPHFEHPHFPLANQLLADAMYWDMRCEAVASTKANQNEKILHPADAKNSILDIKREVSNSRIVAAGMERLPVLWKIDNKVYEPAKIRVFIEAIWVRIKNLEKVNRLSILPGKDALMVQYGKEITVLLREIKGCINEGIDTLDMAKKMFRDLNRMCTLFLETYFRTKMRHFGDVSCP